MFRQSTFKGGAARLGGTEADAMCCVVELLSVISRATDDCAVVRARKQERRIQVTDDRKRRWEAQPPCVPCCPRSRTRLQLAENVRYGA